MTIIAKIKEVKQQLSDISKNLTYDEAKQLIKELQGLTDYVEDVLSDVGVEHQIEIYLGDYGNGRFLILQDIDEWGDKYSAGEWRSSSSTC